jgi:hypothetical protein
VTTALNPETRAVIETVLEAIEIPHAATEGGEEARRKVLSERIMCTVVVLQCLADSPCPDVAQSLGWLRERLAAACPPVGYVTHDQAMERVRAGASWSEAVSLEDGQDGAGLPDNGGASVVWDDQVAPGGQVCAAPSDDTGGADGVCGMPVESEPCPHHGQGEADR